MRRGFTLIELLVVIAGSSVVFSILAIALYTLSRAQGAVRDEAHAAAALHDFARQLRNDAHAAADIVLGDAADPADEPTVPALTFQYDDERTVVYDFNPQKAILRRRVVQSEQTASRESFILPRGSRVQWQAPVETSLLVVLVSRPAGASANPGWRITRIEAAVGLDRIESP